MTDVRDNPRALRLRVLRRRIVLGTAAVIALFFAFWRAWDLESRLFWELLLGSVLLVVGMALVGAAVALLIGWLRKRRDGG